MQLGAFSISLTVKDIAASREFYERIGFKPVAGNEDEDWLVMRNGAALIGLFHDTQEGNHITFNPGWEQDASEATLFTDIRELQKVLKANGLELYREIDPEAVSGPAHFVLIDPDGNSILFEQYR